MRWRMQALGTCCVVLGAVVAWQATRQANKAKAAGGSEESSIDPVEANGPIFVDWPTPDLAIVVTGELDGYIEPCGCAGLENQLGGLKRRHSFINQLEGDGWPVVLLDLGGLVKRTGPQAEIKYRYALESLIEIGYDAVGFGGRDMPLGADALAFPLSNLAPGTNPVVSANVGIYDMAESVELGLTHPYRVVEAGGKRIGVTAVLGERHSTVARNDEDIAYEPPAEALARVIPQLAAENCDWLVLLVHGDPREASELSRQFPQFQIVATAGGAEEPPAQPTKIEGSGALLMEAGHKGMYATVLGFFDDPDPRKRYLYQRVPLDSRFPDSEAMQAKLVDYQSELQTTTLAGLGLTGTAHPDGEFAGSDVCADCHTLAWEVFESTPHYHATETLVNLDPPRQYDPECLSCHVTGWNPQKYFPYASGFFGLEQTPAMVGNGCENCHGPAAEHVAAESGVAEVTAEQQEALRAALRMKIVANEGNKPGQEFDDATVVKNCMECHDLDNSPDFDFQAYWPLVKHVGKE